MIGPGEFYQTSGAASIMSASHFPDVLLPYLQMEAIAAYKATKEYLCDELVEFGCYDGRAIETARSAQISYCGVDINREAISQLQLRLAHDNYAAAIRIVQADVTKPDQWRSLAQGARPLVVLPFHFLGAVQQPLALLQDIAALTQVVLLVSVFMDDDATVGVRRAYYESCGLGSLVEIPSRYGSRLFRGASGFMSDSFSADGLIGLLNRAGWSFCEGIENTVGRCIVARPSYS